MAKGPDGAVIPVFTGFDASPVTPTDDTDLPDGTCRCMWIGGAGDVEFTTLGGTKITWPAVPVGWFMMGASQIHAANTTATGIIAVY